jgi:Tfp pilus tip-associated adhesin PilY1
MVVFGTGRNLSDDDRNSMEVQSFYSIHDNQFTFTGDDVTVGATTVGNRASGQLVNQTATSVGPNEWVSNDAYVDYDAGKRGWYMDLPLANWKVLRNPGWYQGTVMNLEIDKPAVGSNAVNDDVCADTPAEAAEYFRTRMGAASGRAAKLWLNSPNASLTKEGGPDSVDRIGPDGGYNNRLPGDPSGTKSANLKSFVKVPSWRQIK